MQGGLDLPDGLFRILCRVMQHTRRIDRPVDFTDLRNPVLDSGFIDDIQLSPGENGLIVLRRLQVTVIFLSSGRLGRFFTSAAPNPPQPPDTTKFIHLHPTDVYQGHKCIRL
jgi:hypothetical protein